MKSVIQFIIILLFSAALTSCDKDEPNPGIDDFCAIVPRAWECEIIQDDFNQNDIPRNANQPMAIIKFVNREIEFSYFGGSIKANPSLTLDFYPISKKSEMIDFIRSQQLYSWCIPIYYGETKEFFIITSPCFINGGSFTNEANSCIEDLHASLKSIISVNKYDFIGQ